MVQFRDVPVTDAAAVRILDDYFSVRAAAFPGGTYRPARPDPAVFTPPHGVFVVATTDDERVVGCGGIRSLAAEAPTVRFEVKHLFVDPNFRGAHIGRDLLDHLEQRARAWQATELVLDTHHTLTAAGALYDRAGFEPTEPYNDNSNATRWYRKQL
ncbi:GNAT family N-acetyltransferase [Microbacterium sp. YY-01]|uniref:GNAT family N-acetyltransferase n=1 Tax=Microbacterium sp. YY-01 TaxID=3421634 RepID=UPI003D16BD28